MIVSPGRKTVFVHIPKTGGTSLALAWEARAMKDDILVGDTPKAQRRQKRQQSLKTRGRLWKHATLADIDGLIPPDDLENWFVFTLVRNPWARILSYYRWLRQQSFDHPAVTVARAANFSGFLANEQVSEALRRNPYPSYVTLPGGQERCDAFVRLEHLDDDLPQVENHLGIKLRPLPHENRSDAPGDYRSAFSDADAARVADIAAIDIARFGYAFDAP